MSTLELNMSVTHEFDREELVEYFTYLDDLRNSGRTNMFGSSVYLREEFELRRGAALAIVGAWMRTFSRSTSARERADLAGGSPT